VDDPSVIFEPQCKRNKRATVILQRSTLAQQKREFALANRSKHRL